MPLALIAPCALQPDCNSAALIAGTARTALATLRRTPVS
jgi:hypothetical protein